MLVHLNQRETDCPFKRYRDCLPRPNKSGGFSITAGGAGLEIDVVEGDGVIDTWVVVVARSLVTC